MGYAYGIIIGDGYNLIVQVRYLWPRFVCTRLFHIIALFQKKHYLTPLTMLLHKMLQDGYVL